MVDQVDQVDPTDYCGLIFFRKLENKKTGTKSATSSLNWIILKMEFIKKIEFLDLP